MTNFPFSQRRAHLLVFLVAVAACARKNSDEPAEKGSVAQAQAQALVSSGSAAAWKVGQRYRYRLKLTSSLAFGQQPNAFDFDVSGNLMIAPSEAKGGEVTLFMVLENPEILSRVPDQQGQFQAVRDGLARFGCFASFKEGRTTELHLLSGSPAMVVSIYRQIAASLQVAVPERKLERFQIHEYDGTGDYEAEYQRADARTWKKRKLRYSKILGKPSGIAATALQGIVPEVLASQGDIELSEDGRPTKLRMRDELKMPGAQVPVHSTTTLALDAEGVASGAPVLDWKALGDKLTRLGADEPYIEAAPKEVQAAAKASLDEARIGGQTFESITKALRATAAAQPPRVTTSPSPVGSGNQPVVGKEETAQFVALTALLRQRKDAVSEAVQLAKKDPAMANTLVDALASSGSPAAHQALAAMLTAKDVGSKQRLRALTGLARTPVPSAVAVQALKDELVRDPFSAGALFGLGSYALYYRKAGDPAQEKAIGDLLVQRLRHADDIVPRLVVTLEGIANSGYLGAQDDVIHHLDDRRAEVRAAAVRALQSMPGARVDELLASAISSDTDFKVVIAALASARARPSSEVLLRALGNAAEFGRDAGVRYHSVELLAKWGKERPEVRALIQRIATKDSEERVRQLAQSVL